jgi:hypothetical protein
MIEQVSKLLTHGARAAWLNQDAPELVAALCPAEAHPDLTESQRANRAEQLFREAIDRQDLDYYGPVGEIMRCLYGLTDDPALWDTPLRVRIEYAARVANISARKFREYLDEDLEALARELRKTIH